MPWDTKFGQITCINIVRKIIYYEKSSSVC